MMVRAGVLALFVSACTVLTISAAHAQPRPAVRAVYIDREGVIRWQDNRQEVALFGANYTLPSASDYRAAGYLKLDRKKLIDEDMAHFARMGWDALRLSFWGDWENSDKAGNLIANEHLDLQDYLIAKARERGIYILLSPITTYNANWPDELHDTTDPGFSKYYDRGKLGTDTLAFAAQVNYVRQLLEHVNPYTRTALKDEPSILFVEPINEPWHRPENLELSVRYINALVDAVRSTGSDKPVFHNVSQDFRITEAIRKSKMQGVTFGWYPTALNSGFELRGNYLRTADHYNPMLSPELRGLPRIIYEFDSADLQTGYMFPAMARAFRSVGGQFAAMFSYDMMRTASRNLGWQTHYLNLVYTPRKAISAVIAAEAMRRLPRMQTYGEYPQNTRFGDFRVSYEENLSELVATDAFMHAGTTRSAPRDLKRLSRIAAYGSSPIVEYHGEGAYFLEKIREGVWRLEVYPDAVPVRDPFVMPNADKIVTRAIYRSWPMGIALPDLGPTFTVQNLRNPAAPSRRGDAGRFIAEPGVYILSVNGPLARNSLPEFVGALRLDEYHAPAADSMLLSVHVIHASEYLAGRVMQIDARVVDVAAPDSVTLFMRPLGRSWYRRYAMQGSGGYNFRAQVPADSAVEGLYEFVISVARNGVSTTFPDGIHRRPWDWDFSTSTTWSTSVVRPETPLRLFRPAEHVRRLAFTRIGDAGRQGLFNLLPAPALGEPVFHLELPVNGNWSPDDYTASHVITEMVQARGDAMAMATALQIRLRGLGTSQVVHVTLVESDGMAWSVPLTIDPDWTERSIPLRDLKPARSVMLPQAFPGQWSYWLGPPAGRGTPNDRMRASKLERLQISLRKPSGTARPGEYGVEIESVKIVF